MSDPLSADRAAELLLWYFQDATRYVAEGRRRNALRPESEVVLKLALGRHVDFNAAHLSEPRTAATLKVAAAAYVTHMFFRPDATPYQTLGLDPGASPAQIKESFRLLMQLVHPDRQDANLVWPESFATQANRAYGVLRNQDARAKFDREVEARAAMARALHRAAAAAEASKMPVLVRAKGRRGRNLARPVLPEWLTSGVGGYAREHPATTAFALLIAGAGLTVAVMVSEGKEGLLTRDAQESREAARPTASAADAAPLAAVPMVANALAAGTSASGNVNAKRPVVPDSIAPSDSDAPAARDSIPPNAGRAPDLPVVTTESRAAPRVDSTLASVAVAGPETVRVPVAKPVPEKDPPVMRVVAPPEAFAPVSAPAVARIEQSVRPEPPVSSVVSIPTRVAPTPASAPAPAQTSAPAAAPPPAARTEQVAVANPSAAAQLPPATAEIEALFARFVETYERGQSDAFAALFDEDADADLRHGRAAIRGEYGELFRLSEWRRMRLTRVNWRRVGDRALAKGEITVRIGWRDGREVEQQVALDMELVRLDGRVVIAKLSQQPKN